MDDLKILNRHVWCHDCKFQSEQKDGERCGICRAKPPTGFMAIPMNWSSEVKKCTN